MSQPPVEQGTLVVPIEDIARRLGLTDPTPAQRQMIADALSDATDAVEAHLGQPITPATYIERGRWPDPVLGWHLEHDPIEIVSVVAETYPDENDTPTGTFTVTYTAGLNAATDPALAPIRAYVRWAALNAPAVVSEWQERQGADARRLSSVSTEGQSATWQYRTPGGGWQDRPGAASTDPTAPTLEGLDRWRVRGRRVFQRRTAPAVPPFGYYGGIL